MPRENYPTFRLPWPSATISRKSVAARVAELGVGRIHLSISHDGGFATTMVVCEA